MRMVRCSGFLQRRKRNMDIEPVLASHSEDSKAAADPRDTGFFKVFRSHTRKMPKWFLQLRP